ncbi:MAG: hypothetical protein HHJ15_13500 [Rhodoferax sp.]|uniref:hypothetical protein n=1 Tax=Rhodoferax sp. TaxID=50421 RepID=UPI00178F7A21|nr:hypothetical protein [Rhodoferax sp.]NMM20946.1 hypothetical protein [Rhodoferax sp.]
MPTYANIQMPPPKSWDEFEAIVCSAAKNRWNSANFTLHGRQGQRQDGVDVYGRDDKDRLVGVQCKNTWMGVSKGTIRDEVVKAESFQPTLGQLYIATTANTDKRVQAFVRELSEERIKTGRFEITILFWNDIWNDLTLDESRLFQHYPQLKPSKQVDSTPSHDQKLFREFQSAFGYEPAVRLLREQDFGGPFQRKAIQPLLDFVETWDQPEKEFLDKELQTALVDLYKASSEVAFHLVEKTVPVGNCDFASVFSDNLRAVGPRPDWVREEARILNEQAHLFVPKYERFLRLCRDKLVR